MGVSIAISWYSGPQATRNVAMTAPTAAPANLVIVFLRLTGAIIDFLKELVILSDLRVAGLELEGSFVGFSGFVELPFVLIGDGEVVERRRISGVELDGFFPPVDGFAPQ